MPGHYGKHGFWLEKFTAIHDRLALKINRCLRSPRTRMDEQRKDHIDLKRLP